MGYVKDELCEEHQTVRGIIIALEDDLKIRKALSVAKTQIFTDTKQILSLLKNERS